MIPTEGGRGEINYFQTRAPPTNCLSAAFYAGALCPTQTPPKPEKGPLLSGGLFWGRLGRKRPIKSESLRPPLRGPCPPKGALCLMGPFLRAARDLAGVSSETTQSQTPQKNRSRAGPPCEGLVLSGALSARNQGLSGGLFCDDSVASPRKKSASRGPSLRGSCA